MTEESEYRVEADPLGWVLYDADCGFCTGLARRLSPWARRHRLAVLPLQTPWVRDRLGLREDEPPREMVVLTRNGRQHGGADAILFLAQQSPLTRPLAALGRIDLLHRLLEKAYRHVAARRACLSGACGLPVKSNGQEAGRRPSRPSVDDAKGGGGGNRGDGPC